jgi:deoxyribodipyrimidine photo-lyase
MPKTYRVAIHWFRRDLRLTDNTALQQASTQADVVIPCYVASNWRGQHLWTGPKRQHFLCGCLDSLGKNLETIAGQLILRSGPAISVLGQLVRETGADAIFFNRDPDPFGKATEAALEDACREWGVALHGYHDVTLHAPEEVLTKDARPYRVFTPYSRSWLAQPKPTPIPKPQLLNTPRGIESLPGLTVEHWGLTEPETADQIMAPGERAARERLKKAMAGILHGYAERRDMVGIAGTSRLSQDLRFGLLSVRTIYAEAMALREQASPAEALGIDTYIKELAWREFYMALLHFYPQVLEHEFNQEWIGLPWDEPGESFTLWKEGRTGFPIIDAAMRELVTTGHMHNRARMIVAMFLTKDLHLDWRLGEQFFHQQLIDAEIASNNGGWQWSAGTGADAAPYFRIQNPWTQSERFDPDGVYIKRWVPELRGVSPALLHAPPKFGRPLAAGYPLPCLDHNTERNRTLDRFKRHREKTASR